MELRAYSQEPRKTFLLIVMLERLSVPGGAGQTLSGRGGKANRSRGTSQVLGNGVTTLEQMRKPR
jgi:hypothetical protein